MHLLTNQSTVTPPVGRIASTVSHGQQTAKDQLTRDTGNFEFYLSSSNSRLTQGQPFDLVALE